MWMVTASSLSIRAAIVVVAAIAGTGCATLGGAPSPADVDTAIRARTADRGIRLAAAISRFLLM